MDTDLRLHRAFAVLRLHLYGYRYRLSDEHRTRNMLHTGVSRCDHIFHSHCKLCKAHRAEDAHWRFSADLCKLYVSLNFRMSLGVIESKSKSVRRKDRVSPFPKSRAVNIHPISGCHSVPPCQTSRGRTVRTAVTPL